MSVILRLLVELGGIFLIAITLRSVAASEITERQSLFWIFTGLSIFVFGLFPILPVLLADLFDVVYAPSIVFAISLLFVLYGIFYCFRGIAALHKRQQEIAMQIALLNQENAALLRALNQREQADGQTEKKVSA